MDLATLLSLLCTLTAVHTLPAKPPANPINLVVINVDGLGWGDVGLYSPWRDDTPNIDSLAAEGVVLDNLYCETSATATSAAFLSGKLGVSWGLYSSNQVESTKLHPDSGFVLPEDIRLLPKVLRSNGYSTKFVGRWNLGQRSEANPTHFGFDEFMGTVSDIPLEHSDGLLKPNIGFYQNEKIVARIPRDLELNLPGRNTYEFTKLYTEEAEVFVLKSADNGPFYLHLSLDALKHLPYRSNDFIRSSYSSRNTTFTDALMEVDNLVKVVYNALKSGGVLDKTIILFAAQTTALFSQFNAGSNSPFSGDSGSTSEGGLRVPAVISLQGRIISSEKRSKLLMNFADLHATLMSLMGIDKGIPACADPKCIVDGINLAPVLSNVTADEVVTRSVHPVYRGRTLMAVRWGRYKAHRIVYPYAESPVLSSLNITRNSQSDIPVVFDVINDPREKFSVGPNYSQASQRFTEAIPLIESEISYVLDTVELGSGLLNECNVVWREWTPPGCEDIENLCNLNMPEGKLRMCQAPIWAVG